ncbi:MAG TPA: hypothetical protein VKQ11_02450 [Candidatus Sulfotelmatobacter sp.]|nr:hypothetical protein [Candidatus Sulfotelmatobacter sp.]
MIDKETLKIKAPERAARAAALTVAAGAVACGVCCVLPFALPAVALASAGGVIAWFSGVQLWATVLAAIIVAAAWIWIVVQSVRANAKPARSTIYMMGIATSVLLLALFWSRIEPLIVQALKV